jgi:hypothetical protein
VSCCRPVQSAVSLTANSGDLSPTRLLSGPTGPYGLQNPTGPVTVLISPGWTNDPRSLFNESRVFTPGNVRMHGTAESSSGFRDHPGCLPTMLVARSNSLTNRTGAIRYWVCATEDKQNGVWASVERMTDVTGAPNLLSVSQQSVFFVVNNNPGQISSDGREADFAIRNQGNPRNVPERILRLSIGYTIGGADTVVATYDSLVATNTGSTYFIELAVDAESVTSAGSPNLVRAASVTFWNDTDEPSDLFTFSFDIDRRAAHSQQRHLQSRHSLIDIQHNAATGTQPQGLLSASLSDVVARGFSSIPPLANNRPTGVIPYGPNRPGPFSIGAGGTAISIDRGGYLYDETDVALRADIVDLVPFAAKTAPSWHEQRLVAHGTQKAVDGATHSLTFTLPANGPAMAVDVFPVTGLGPNGFGVLRYEVVIRNFNSLNQTKALTLGPSINGRPLMPCCYHGEFEIPEFSLSGTDGSNLYSIAVTGRIESFARTYRTGNIDEFPTVDGAVNRQRRNDFANQFPTMHEAMEAGIDPDTHWFYKNPTLGGSPRNLITRRLTSGRIDVTFVTKLRFVFSQVGEWNGSYTGHCQALNFVSMFMDDSVCADLANGQTVSARLGGTMYGTVLGTPSDFVAPVSLA